jgi:hypothetical protein
MRQLQSSCSDKLSHRADAIAMVEVRGEIHVSAARAHWVRRPDTRRVGVRFEAEVYLSLTTKRKFSSPAWNPAPVSSPYPVTLLT